MTKSTTAVLDVTTVSAPAPANVSGLPPSPVPKPMTVLVSGFSMSVLQQVTHLCRAGYTVDVNVPLFTSPETGMMAVAMVIGSPEQIYVDAAIENLKDAQAAQEARYYRDVQQAAAKQIEDAEKAKKAAKKAELVAAHEAAMKQLQDEIAAL